MNRSFCKIAYSLSVLVLLLACQDKKREENVIKIGAILPLTGNMAYLGESIKKGMDMACAHLNNENTIKIEIIYGDSKGDNKTGIDLSKKYVEQDKIKIVTTFLTGISNSVKKITEDNNVLLLAQTVSPTICRNSKNTIRFHYSFVSEGEKINEYILSSKIKKIGIIHSGDPSTSYEIDSIINPFLKQNDIDAYIEKFEVGKRDFSTIALKYSNINDVEMLFIAGYGNDIPYLLSELKKYKFKKPIIGNIGMHEIPKGFGMDIYEGITFTLPKFYIDASYIPNNYKQYYDILKPEGYEALYAYDLITLIDQILDSEKDLSKLRKKLVGQHQCAFGNYFINESGDTKDSCILVKYENAKTIVVN